MFTKCVNADQYGQSGQTESWNHEGITKRPGGPAFSTWTKVRWHINWLELKDVRERPSSSHLKRQHSGGWVYQPPGRYAILCRAHSSKGWPEISLHPSSSCAWSVEDITHDVQRGASPRGGCIRRRCTWSGASLARRRLTSLPQKRNTIAHCSFPWWVLPLQRKCCWPTGPGSVSTLCFRW